MTGATAPVHPAASSPIPPPPQERHPKHPAILFATHLSQTSAQAFDPAHQDAQAAASDPSPDTTVSDAAVLDTQPEYVHSTSDTHANPGLPEVSHTGHPSFGVPISDHAHQEHPHLSHQTVSVMAPVTQEELQDAGDHSEQISSPADHETIRAQHLSHADQPEDSQRLRLDRSASAHPVRNAVPNSVGDSTHVEAPVPTAPTEQRDSAGHIRHSADVVQAVHQELHEASLLVQSASASNSQHPSEDVGQNVHDAVDRALERPLTSSEIPSLPDASHRRFDTTAAIASTEVLEDQMLTERKPEPHRITANNSGILQHLAAHTGTPKSKRARLEQKSPAILARGASISLARRAAATAKKRRDEARAELERNGISEGVERALEGIVGISASTRANVSQNREKRVQRVKWRVEEVEALQNGVEKYGVGRWAVILREFANAFDPVRISVDLKDKWRNIFKIPKSRTQRSRVNVDQGQPSVMAGYAVGNLQHQAQQANVQQAQAHAHAVHVQTPAHQSQQAHAQQSHIQQPQPHPHPSHQLQMQSQQTHAEQSHVQQAQSHSAHVQTHVGEAHANHVQVHQTPQPKQEQIVVNDHHGEQSHPGEHTLAHQDQSMELGPLPEEGDESRVGPVHEAELRTSHIEQSRTMNQAVSDERLQRTEGHLLNVTHHHELTEVADAQPTVAMSDIPQYEEQDPQHNADHDRKRPREEILALDAAMEGSSSDHPPMEPVTPGYVEHPHSVNGPQIAEPRQERDEYNSQTDMFNNLFT